MANQTFINFFKKESATGILLLIATVAAMAVANSPFRSFYDDFNNIPVTIQIGHLIIAKPLLLWINDGLMAIFFFMVGLEIKREVIEGELKDPRKIAVPALAALGGMVMPALIYVAFNLHHPEAMAGWAIPTATDIAFALGILSLLGERISPKLKLFLLTLAIIDDLGAIIVIALFYTENLSFSSLAIVAVTLILLFIMNRRGVVNHAAYILVGIVMWTAMLKSGVHATLAGVMLGLFIPIAGNKENFHRLEHSLHAPVNFVILPLFAFVNTGINFAGIGYKDFVDTLTLGIAMGLFLGKQLGIFLFSWAAIKMRLGRLPEGVGFKELYGLGIIGGVGFTMSLFIGSLAFESGSVEVSAALVDERIGILIGSLLSGFVGYLYLRRR